MSDVGRRLRGLFEEIAPSPDMEEIFGMATPSTPRRRSWALAVTGIALLVGLTVVVMLLDSDQPPFVATTVPDVTPSTLGEGEATAALLPAFVECRHPEVSGLVYPCFEVADFDLSTALVTPSEMSPPLIVIRFDEEVTVFGINLRNLVDYGDFVRRTRIRQIELTSESGASVIVDFADTNAEQNLLLESGAIRGREITVRVVAVYPSQSFEDQPAVTEFALAELTLVGRAPTTVTTVTAPPDTGAAFSWDGQWSQVTLDPSRRGQARALVSNGREFALVTRMEGGDVLVWESSDGLDWEVVAELGAVDTLGGPMDIIPVEDAWVIVGSQGTGGRAAAWLSAGGGRQVLIDTDPDSPGSIATSVVEHGGRLVAVGYYEPTHSGFPPEVTPAIWASEDGGNSWQPVDISAPLLWMFRVVVAGPNGLMAFADSTVDVVVGPGRMIFQSDDGLSWEQLTPIGFSPFQLDSVFGDSNGYVVLDDISGGVWESSDGVQWNRTPLPVLGEQRSGRVSSGYQGVGRFQNSIVAVGWENYDGPVGFNVLSPLVAMRTEGGWAVTARLESLGYADLVAVGHDRLVMAGELGPTEDGPNERVSVFVFVPTNGEELPCTDRTPALSEQPYLPAAVAETRHAIHAAAVNCDWGELSRLATQGDFLYTIGGQGGMGDPVQYWIERMRQGEDVLGDIATVLTLPARENVFGDDEIEWVWPSVAYKDPGESTDADWQSLLPLYDQDRIDLMRPNPEGYIGGFFLQISDDGTWTAAGTMSV